MTQTKFRPSISNSCCASQAKEVIEELIEEVGEFLYQASEKVDINQSSEIYAMQLAETNTLLSIQSLLNKKYEEVIERSNR